jgi:Alanine-zipper, major outer membrane lipoprotein
MARSGTLRAVAGSFILALAAAGCASTGSVDTAKGDAQEALRLAQEANTKSNLAAADAAAARAAAEAAAKDAQEANAKADRIFQRSLHK